MSDCCCGEKEPKKTACCCEDEPVYEECCCEEAAEPCCCGGSDEACCCDDDCCCGDDCCCEGDDCCGDVAYAGPKETVTVDLLFLDLAVCDRCQGADDRVFEAIKRCKPVLSACGYEIELNQILVDTEEKAYEHRFASSPTIRVNGIDICPDVVENDCGCCSDMSDALVKCRLFPFNGTYYEVPPTDMIVRAIVEIVLQGKTREDEGAYELPENIREFLAGVERMAAKGAERPSLPEERKRCCCC